MRQPDPGMALHSLTKKQSRPDNWAVRSPQPRAPIANLRDTARLTGPYQVWVTDVAYGHIRSGLVYAAAVIDAWSREVVGYAASLQITNRLAADSAALRRPGASSGAGMHPPLNVWNAIPYA
jgi:transposase InsO family protein